MLFGKGQKMARTTTTTNSSSLARQMAQEIPPQVRRQIEELAYRLYEQRGRQPGHEIEDWVEAERRILGKRR